MFNATNQEKKKLPKYGNHMYTTQDNTLPDLVARPARYWQAVTAKLKQVTSQNPKSC